MKLATISLVCLGLGVMQAMAAPAQNNKIPRQNDMPQCKDGVNGPAFLSFYDNGHCDNDCTYEENSGENKGYICTGQCKENIPLATPGGPRMPPSWYCSGVWDE